MISLLAHPRDMPEPPPGMLDGGPGACSGCNVPPGYHRSWCAQRGASDAEIVKLRAARKRSPCRVCDRPVEDHGPDPDNGTDFGIPGDCDGYEPTSQRL